jgi:hypothetical protein
MRNQLNGAAYRIETIEADSHSDSPAHRVSGRPQSAQKTQMTRLKKACLIAVAVLVLTPLTLTAQAPTTANASKPDSTVAHEPESGDTNESAKLAIKLTNPVASLISIPVQNWFDFNLGPKKDGFRYTMEAQPVYPMQISKEWNLISRSTIPVIYQQNLYGRTSQTGLSDSTESLFLSPVHTKSLIWGAGPVFLVPTGTDGFLSTRKFGMGPTAVVLKHATHGNIGLLANHVWSVAGSDSHPYVSQTYAQPFVTYTTKTAWTFAINSYDTYDWKTGRWTAVVNPIRVSKLMKFGHQRMSIGATPRCVVTSPQYQPKGCGLEFTVTPLYPAKR